MTASPPVSALPFTKIKTIPLLLQLPREFISRSASCKEPVVLLWIDQRETNTDFHPLSKLEF